MEFLEELNMLAEAGRWQDVCEALERSIQAESDQGVKIGRLMLRANVLEKRLVDLAGARRDWRRILEIDPGNGSALEALERIYRLAEDWPALIELLERKAKLVAKPRKRALQIARCARICWDNLQDAAKTRALCQQALALDPKNAEALALADELLER
jgi:tetratricopeptide (TPR) repeat protein